MLPKFLSFTVFSCIILFIISGCVVGNGKGKMAVNVDPHRAYEECVTLLANQVLDYSFEATKPVDFNIHYHAEGGIFYPVSQKNVSSWKGTFSPLEEKGYTEEQEYFCMMWENPHAEYVRLTFQYKIVNK